MKILAIDTSASACSVALSINNKIFAAHDIAPMQQAQMILPMIHDMLKTANVTFNQLDALAFGCGPGSFTGVRIAASVMQGIAFATELPLIKISSLAATAQAAYEDLGWKKLLVGMDARIQEVYWGIYQANDAGRVVLIGDEIVCPPQAITHPEQSDWYGVGTGWAAYRETLLNNLPFKPLSLDETRLPVASAIINLAKDKLERRDFVTLEEALPVYLRDDVAVKQKK